MLKTASIQAVENELKRLQSSANIHWLDQSARTAQQAATSLGVEVGQIAKSVIFSHAPSHRHVLAVTAGDKRVDVNKVNLVLEAMGVGGSVHKADADFVKAQSGFVIGGVSPLAHLNTPITLIDISLSRFQQLWAAAGHAHAVFSLSFAELCLWLNVTPYDITVD